MVRKWYVYISYVLLEDDGGLEAGHEVVEEAACRCGELQLVTPTSDQVATHKLKHKRNAIQHKSNTCPLAPTSEFLKKGLSGKYNLVCTCPNTLTYFQSCPYIFI